jgi:hypothetical protein
MPALWPLRPRELGYQQCRFINGHYMVISAKGPSMVDASQIREHMEIKGSDGGHIGTVDRVEGNRIKLTKSDPASGGAHKYMDLSQVSEIKDGCVVAGKAAEECKQKLQ